MSNPKPSWQNKETLLEELRNNVCHIRFIKVNGDEREMTCTLMEHMLPVHETNTKDPANFPEPIPAVKDNPDVIRCYDLSVAGWRSFRVDSVIEAYKLGGYES